MAYKFQFGTTKLSGSTTFEEALVGESTISGSGRLSGKELILDAAGVIGTSADADLITLTSDNVVIAGDLSASLALAGKDLLLDATSNIGVDGDTDLLTLSANSVVIAGDLSASIALAGKDVLLDDGGKIGVAADTDLLTLTDGIVTVAGDVKAVELSGSSTLSVEGASSFGPGALATISAAGVIDGVILSGSTAVSGALGEFSDIDADLITTEKLTVTDTFGAVTLSASLGITGSSLEIYAEGGGGVPFFEAQNGILSASGVSTLYSINADAARIMSIDVEGGAIDNATIGATTQSSGKFTTLSASSTVDIAGQARFGTENQLTVSSVGVLSGSAIATFDEIDMDRASIEVLLGDVSGSDGLSLGGQVAFGNSRLVVSDTQVLMTGPVHVSGAAFQDENLTVAKLNEDSILYFDAGSGELRRDQFSNYASVLAGTGITATNGVLSVDTTGGDSVSATHIPEAAYGNHTLTVGLNFMTVAATGSCSFLLPSGSAGDVVIVKTAADVSSTNFVKISSSVAQGDEIDGFSEARIESPFGAVSLVYSNSDGKWVIY